MGGAVIGSRLPNGVRFPRDCAVEAVGVVRRLSNSPGIKVGILTTLAISISVSIPNRLSGQMKNGKNNSNAEPTSRVTMSESPDEVSYHIPPNCPTG